MFYKIKNAALILLFCLFAVYTNAKAQGLVSLSEEAMFDDELESGNNAEESVAKPASPEVPDALPSAPEKASAADKAPVLPALEVPAAQPAPSPSSESFSEESFSADLFSKMSDLEKRTSLMNLELKREKLQNEIEAVKNQRKQALIQEQEKAEAARLKALEKEKELERKLLIEQEKLRELDIKFETLRQEKLLGSYKNKMLEENQKWIEHDAVFYKQLAALRQEKRDMAEGMKEKLSSIKQLSESARQEFVSKVLSYKGEISRLQDNISALRRRIDILEKEKEEAKKNPFADAAGLSVSDEASSSDIADAEPTKVGLPELYAVTEVRGQNGELIAKLINRSGTSFYVKQGTTLQSGHIISEITSTYVAAEKGGIKDYIYFAAGGILPTETRDFRLEKDDFVDNDNN